MKPARHQPRAGHDRWLVSYADLVTLLFAFFTTLYAASAVETAARPDGGATGQPEQTTSGTETPGVLDPTTGAAGMPGPPEPTTGGTQAAEAAATASGHPPGVADPLQERLRARLEDDVRLQRADIVRDGRGLVISLPERATFAVGSAVVTADARPLIARVVDELSGGQYALRIEGHTDDVPIKTSRYPSNWELSTARAGAVVAYLIADRGFPAGRLSAAGYGQFHPRVPNDSPDNRARNRRIDIVVLDLNQPAIEGTLRQ